MIKKIATNIWNMSEFYKVPLGFLAPHVFGLMVGATSKKKEKGLIL